MQLESGLFQHQTFLKYSDGKKLIRWLTAVQECYNICDDTIMCGIEIVRRVLTRFDISRCDFRLVGIISLMLASKFDSDDPELYALHCARLCDVSTSEANRMEWLIFSDVLNFSIPRSVAISL